MPELPEVEVVKKSLEKQISNLIVKNVKIKDGNLRYKVKKRDIAKIIGLKIINIKRRSKYLLFFFNKDFVMIVHLGMTGKFFIKKTKKPKLKTSFYYEINETNTNKHDRLVFNFSNKTKLIYNDVRKFGFIKFYIKKKISDNPHLKILGPEPLDDLFNHQYFKDYLIGRKRLIKDLLMDQKFVSGLGNIYVNEILYLSQIRPNRRTNKLKDSEIAKITKNVKKILKRAILLGGSSIKDFTNSSGKKGGFQQHFNVYGKKGYKCSNSDCKGTVRKIVISNRASFFCPICQK
tara:strand:- start:6981 stop:7850 length:870 start_codon:yes stop_codon:yes gene_type:complete